MIQGTVRLLALRSAACGIPGPTYLPRFLLKGRWWCRLDSSHGRMTGPILPRLFCHNGHQRRCFWIFRISPRTEPIFVLRRTGVRQAMRKVSEGP